jgi:hypothetical protein
MATSGSTDFILNRDQILQVTLEKVRAVRVGGTPSTAMIASASTELNLIVKRLQKKGVRLWKQEFVQHTFTASSEVTGTDSEIYTCIKDHTSSTATKPITGANWTSFWVKRGTTGGVWADVTSYTSIGQFSLAADTITIEKAWMRRDGYDHPISIKGMGYYAELVEKTADGLPDNLYVNLLTSPEVYLDRHPDNTDDVLHYFRTAMIEDFDATDDDPDFPVDWIQPLIKLLVAAICGTYDIPIKERYLMIREAKDVLEEALGDDTEDVEHEFVEPLYPPRQ